MLFQGWETIGKNTRENLENILLNDEVPSCFFRDLHDKSWLEKLFPELAILVKVEQKRDYHPEGNVFEHTMQALDAAAKFEYRNCEEKRIIMFAVLCHDYGKAKSLAAGEDMMGHDIAGVPLTKRFLERFSYGDNLMKLVCKLVLYHKKPFEIFNGNPDMDGYNEMKKCFNDELGLKLIVKVFWADIRGRNGFDSRPLSKGKALQQLLKIDGKLLSFMTNIKHMAIENGPEPPVLGCEDLSENLLIVKAYQLQVDERITDKGSLKSLVHGEFSY